jgi:uncharacterized membrane protein
MRTHFTLAAVLAFTLAGAVSACGGEGADEDQQAAVDRELDLAMAEDSLAEFGDVAAEGRDEPTEAGTDQAPPPRRSPPPATPTQTAPEERAPAPRQDPPQPSGPRYEEAAVAAGTGVRVSLDHELSTKDNQAGDLFTATLLAPITDGRQVVVPAGAKFRGEVTAVQASGGQGQQAVMKIDFYEVSFDGQTHPVSVTVTDANPTTKGRDSTGEKAAKIGAGAVVGGILGRVIGGNAAGTIIGGVLGGAAGTAIALGTEDVDAVLAEGSEMGLRLDEPLTVRREVESG